MSKECDCSESTYVIDTALRKVGDVSGSPLNLTLPWKGIIQPVSPMLGRFYSLFGKLCVDHFLRVQRPMIGCNIKYVLGYLFKLLKETFCQVHVPLVPAIIEHRYPLSRLGSQE